MAGKVKLSQGVLLIPGKRAPSTASTRWKFPGFSSSPSSDTVSVLESGSSLFEKANKYKIPAIAIEIPTFPSSNIVKPSYPASRIMPCTTRFVEVPIKVHIPPNIVTYERGIKNFVAGSLTASAHRLMIGAKITTTGVLFRNADTKATGGSILACALKTVVFPSGSSFLINWPQSPALPHSLTDKEEHGYGYHPFIAKALQHLLGSKNAYAEKKHDHCQKNHSRPHLYPIPRRRSCRSGPATQTLYQNSSIYF